MQLGGYEVAEVLGRGGAGTVYRAKAPDGRVVALKLLKAGRPEALARFERERRLQTTLGEEAGFVPLVDASATTP